MVYEYEYKAKDGRLVSIKPDERYILVSKSSEHWWHVCKDLHTRPFYVPAQYVKELSAPTKDSSGPNKLDVSDCVNDSEQVDGTGKARNTTAMICVTALDAPREVHRFSTFGFCGNITDVKPTEPLKEMTTKRSPANTLNHTKTHNATVGGFSFPSPPPNTEGIEGSPEPEHDAKSRNKKRRPKSSPQNIRQVAQTPMHDGLDLDFPSPPSPIPDIIPEINITDFDSFPEPPDSVPSSDEAAKQQQQRLAQTAETAPLIDEQVIL